MIFSLAALLVWFCRISRTANTTLRWPRHYLTVPTHHVLNAMTTRVYQLIITLYTPTTTVTSLYRRRGTT